VKVEVGLKF